VRQRIVVGRHEPAVAERAQVLAREEREASHRAHAAGGSIAITRADRLRRVLDDRRVGASRDLEHRIHIGAQAIQMDGNDRAGARRDRSGHRRRVDVEGERIDVDETRRRAKTHDRPRCREERERRGDHLVAGTDAERHERDDQRVGSRRHADGVSDADRGRDLVLQRLDLRTTDEALAVTDAGDRRKDVVAQRTVLLLQIEQRDVHRRRD
jgi:hypothetical protein